MPEARRSYDSHFKEGAVRAVRETGKSITPMETKRAKSASSLNPHLQLLGLEEFRRRDAQGVCQRIDVVQPYVALASFEARYVRPVNASCVGKLLLRYAAGRPERSDPATEGHPARVQRFGGPVGHDGVTVDGC